MIRSIGYYARGTRQVGRGGDFFTSVSVGPLFGRCSPGVSCANGANPAARRAGGSSNAARTTARSPPMCWRKSHLLDARAFEALEYAIPEPLPSLRPPNARPSPASRKPCDFRPTRPNSPTIRCRASRSATKCSTPCPATSSSGAKVAGMRVPRHIDRGRRLRLADRNIHDPLLRAALGPLGTNFPEGYRTEVRTGFAEFLAPLARALDGGLMLWVDYGFARPEYYHPDRITGTLRTFSKHRAGEDPLAHPGEADITAHVDFTAVAEAAMALGGQPLVFQNQGAWLTEIARDWLLEQEGNPKTDALRQFQTLTHPAHLGRGFHMLELSWRESAVCEDRSTLAHRLFGSAGNFPPAAAD